MAQNLTHKWFAKWRKEVDFGRYYRSVSYSIMDICCLLPTLMNWTLLNWTELARWLSLHVSDHLHPFVDKPTVTCTWQWHLPIGSSKGDIIKVKLHIYMRIRSKGTHAKLNSTINHADNQFRSNTTKKMGSNTLFSGNSYFPYRF